MGEAWDEDLQQFVKSGLRREGDVWVLTLSSPVRLQILKQLYRFRPEVALAAIDAPVGRQKSDEAMRIDFCPPTATRLN